MNINELEQYSFKDQLMVFLFRNGITSRIDISTFGSNSGRNSNTIGSTLYYLKKQGFADNHRFCGLWHLTENGIDYVKRLYDHILQARYERWKMSYESSVTGLKEKAAELEVKNQELEVKNQELEEKVKQLEADNARYIRIIDRITN